MPIVWGPNSFVCMPFIHWRERERERRRKWKRVARTGATNLPERGGNRLPALPAAAAELEPEPKLELEPEPELELEPGRGATEEAAAVVRGINQFGARNKEASRKMADEHLERALSLSLSVR